jgi:hypothetical protein
MTALALAGSKRSAALFRINNMVKGKVSVEDSPPLYGRSKVILERIFLVGSEMKAMR